MSRRATLKFQKAEKKLWTKNFFPVQKHNAAQEQCMLKLEKYNQDQLLTFCGM